MLGVLSETLEVVVRSDGLWCIVLVTDDPFGRLFEGSRHCRGRGERNGRLEDRSKNWMRNTSEKS